MMVSAYFWGLGIWVSSTSFQKSNIDWPQQPPTEKELICSMSFHDSVKKTFFSKHQNKCFKSLDYCFQEPGWLSSDFPGLTNLCNLIDLSGLCSLTGLNSLYSHISSKNILVLMVWSSLAPKLPILVIFCRMDHQKSNFLLIYGTSLYWRLLRPAYVTFLKTGWWNSNAQTSGIYRYLHYNLNVVFSWPPRSSKSELKLWKLLSILSRQVAIWAIVPNEKCLKK